MTLHSVHESSQSHFLFKPTNALMKSTSPAFFFSLHRSTLKELINQGRQKVLEATNALKALPREPLEDIIGHLVSNWDEREMVI